MTTEEWTRVRTEVVDYWKADGVAKAVAIEDGEGLFSVWSGRGSAEHLVNFDPTVIEARAVMQMPMRWDESSPITREAVHSFIRAHGSVEEMESITARGSLQCPGCGRGGSPEHPRKATSAGDRMWHSDCLARVQARTTAAEPVEPEWLTEARRKLPPGWKIIDATNAYGAGPHYDLVRPSGYRHPAFELRDWPIESAIETCRAGRPGDEQPAAPRPFRKGDRVRGNVTGRLATVAHDPGPGDAVVDVLTDLHGNEAWYASDATLVTPAPEALQTPTCGEKHGDNCYLPAGHEGVCSDMVDEAGYYTERKPAPYVHEGAVPTNPAGFPVMPAAAMTTVEKRPCRVHGGTATPGPGCEACERHEAPEYEPMIGAGDEVEFADPQNPAHAMRGLVRLYDDGTLISAMTGELCIRIKPREYPAEMGGGEQRHVFIDARRCRLLTRKEDR